MDAPIIKILAGIRRCGKSTILEMLHKELISKGIDESNIICKRYTSFEIDDCYTAKDMYNDIKKEMINDNKYYLLLDEVQEIDGWEKAINSLLEDTNADIYVTGSNSKLMSSEISTYLTGRYVLIPVYPLSFKEYLDFFREDVFADMISKKSGYTDMDEILMMIKVMKDMNKSAEETGDWQTIYPSAIMRWAQHRKYKDIITAARSTIRPAASKNLEVQKEIMDNILNHYW